MSHDTRFPGQKWVIGAAIAFVGLIAATVVDFAVRNPLVACTIVLVPLSFAGRSAPFNYLEDELDRIHDRAADFLSAWVVPLTIVAGVIYAMHQMVFLGFGRGLIVVIAIYLIDRGIAGVVRSSRFFARRRHARRDEEPIVIVSDNVN